MPSLAAEPALDLPFDIDNAKFCLDPNNFYINIGPTYQKDYDCKNVIQYKTLEALPRDTQLTVVAPKDRLPKGNDLKFSKSIVTAPRYNAKYYNCYCTVELAETPEELSKGLSPLKKNAYYNEILNTGVIPKVYGLYSGIVFKTKDNEPIFTNLAPEFVEAITGTTLNESFSDKNILDLTNLSGFLTSPSVMKQYTCFNSLLNYEKSFAESAPTNPKFNSSPSLFGGSSFRRYYSDMLPHIEDNLKLCRSLSYNANNEASVQFSPFSLPVENIRWTVYPTLFKWNFLINNQIVPMRVLGCLFVTNNKMSYNTESFMIEFNSIARSVNVSDFNCPSYLLPSYPEIVNLNYSNFKQFTGFTTITNDIEENPNYKKIRSIHDKKVPSAQFNNLITDAGLQSLVDASFKRALPEFAALRQIKATITTNINEINAFVDRMYASLDSSLQSNLQQITSLYELRNLSQQLDLSSKIANIKRQRAAEALTKSKLDSTKTASYKVTADAIAASSNFRINSLVDVHGRTVSPESGDEFYKVNFETILPTEIQVFQDLTPNKPWNPLYKIIAGPWYVTLTNPNGYPERLISMKLKSNGYVGVNSNNKFLYHPHTNPGEMYSMSDINSMNNIYPCMGNSINDIQSAFARGNPIDLIKTFYTFLKCARTPDLWSEKNIPLFPFYFENKLATFNSYEQANFRKLITEAKTSMHFSFTFMKPLKESIQVITISSKLDNNQLPIIFTISKGHRVKDKVIYTSVNSESLSFKSFSSELDKFIKYVTRYDYYFTLGPNAALLPFTHKNLLEISTKESVNAVKE